MNIRSICAIAAAALAAWDAAVAGGAPAKPLPIGAQPHGNALPGMTNQMEVVREAIARRERQMGGMLVCPGSGAGRIAFVNCQEKFGQNAIDDIAQQLRKLSRLNIVAVRGDAKLDPAEARKAHGAEVTIVIADRPDGPLMLLAPEDCWGMVNVARIAAGERFNAGCCKALLRTFGMLCGGGLSLQQGNVLSEVKLEKTYDLQNVLPQDVTVRQLKFLAEMGVKPERRTTYRKACEEGWAPAPTNDVQKAIWDKVHEMPTEPIKIKPETKKVAN